MMMWETAWTRRSVLKSGAAAIAGAAAFSRPGTVPGAATERARFLFLTDTHLDMKCSQANLSSIAYWIRQRPPGIPRIARRRCVYLVDRISATGKMHDAKQRLLCTLAGSAGGTEATNSPKLQLKGGQIRQIRLDHPHKRKPGMIKKRARGGPSRPTKFRILLIGTHSCKVMHAS